ncbi:MAG: hypothetical protein ACOCZ8_00340 [Bacteroidota bacterium]
MKVQSYTPGEREIQEAYEKALIDSVATKLAKDGFDVELYPNSIRKTQVVSDPLARETDWRFWEPDIIASKGDLQLAYIISDRLYSMPKDEFKELIETLKSIGYKVKYMLHKPPRIKYAQFEDIQTFIENDDDISQEILSEASSKELLFDSYQFVYFDVTDVVGSFKSKSFTISGTAVVRVFIRSQETKGATNSGVIDPVSSEDLHFEFSLDLALNEKSNEFFIEDYNLIFT